MRRILLGPIFGGDDWWFLFGNFGGEKIRKVFGKTAAALEYIYIYKFETN